MNAIQDITAAHYNPPTSVADMALAGASAPQTEQAKIEHEVALGQRLAQARKAAKLTKTALAKMVGMKANDIFQFETAAWLLSLDQARELAAALGVDITWLWLGRTAPLAVPELSLPALPSTDLSLDADILRACAELDALEREYVATNKASDGDDDRLREISDAQTPWVDLLGETRAKTIEGIRAKARSLALWAPDLVSDEPGDTIAVLTSSIIEDLIGVEPLATVTPTLDALLLDLCRQLVANLNRVNEEDIQTSLDGDDPLRVEQRRLLAAILDARPTTLAGHRARAFAVLEWHGSIGGDGQLVSCFNDDEVWPILRDLIGPDILEAVRRNVLRLCERGDGKPNRLPSLLAEMFSGSAPQVDPDTAYIAMCEDLVGTEAKRASALLHHDTLLIGEQVTYEKRVIRPLEDKSERLFDRLLGMDPQTPAGQQAAARALIAFMGRHPDGTPDIETNHVGEKLAWKLVGQLAGQAQAVSAGLARSAQA